MDSLGTDHLAVIMSKIASAYTKSVCSMASKTWAAASKIPMSWQHTIVREYHAKGAVKARELFALLQTHGQNIQSLEMHVHEVALGVELLQRIAIHCTGSLRSLELHAVLPVLPVLGATWFRDCVLYQDNFQQELCLMIAKLAAAVKPGKRLDFFVCNILLQETIDKFQFGQEWKSMEPHPIDLHHGLVDRDIRILSRARRYSWCHSFTFLTADATR